MRFLRLPMLMALIALASTLVPNVSFVLRFAALMLAALTILGALSDIQAAARRTGLSRDELLKLWFGGKLRQHHTWEALQTEVAATASALRLPPPPPPAPKPSDPLNNSNHHSGSIPTPPSSGKLPRTTPATTSESASPPVGQVKQSGLVPMLRLFALEVLSEAIILAIIVLNWFNPAQGATMGEQVSLLIVGVLSLGLLWYDWRLLRRFVAAVQAQLTQPAP